MMATNILLLDFNPASRLGEALGLQLGAMPDPSVVIQREPFQDFDINQLREEFEPVMAGAADLVILVLSNPAQAAAADIFCALLGQNLSAPIVVVPDSYEPRAVNELYRFGASDYLTPPFRPVDVHPRIQRLLAHYGSEKTPLAELKQSLGSKQLVGESPALMEQVQKIPRLARCDASVLITGETGTGKEICARAIHYLSPRADRPFVPLNCGAIPVELLENELFGHGQGAFTSANASQVGVIQEANGGTLFLDEVDSLTLPAQVKLLRFLQDKEFRPLGVRKSSRADVRIIAASNANIEELLSNGRMRRDLYYRLNVMPLHLPPLRERKEDIPLLARHFLEKFRDEFGGEKRDILPAALRKLSLYDWPGNVRELENVIGRAAVLSENGIIRSDEIDLPVGTNAQPEAESFRLLKSKVVENFERSYLRALLERYQGNIAHAARAAQKNRRVFFQLMRKHHIRVEHAGRSGGNPVVNIVIGVDKKVLRSNGL